ncbi:hypothetical protein AVEN_187667-1 [Araneus ventricosus]|uniref:Uncharacterized protein n=1 Tax=Araneus ventricosus TaxID=182803 RepID=A0A4Y2J118_ARAVE|nr:hypothetical protein AVEN_187667-1 [Araneus ventricosus]
MEDKLKGKEKNTDANNLKRPNGKEKDGIGSLALKIKFLILSYWHLLCYPVDPHPWVQGTTPITGKFLIIKKVKSCSPMRCWRNVWTWCRVTDSDLVAVADLLSWVLSLLCFGV